MPETMLQYIQHFLLLWFFISSPPAWAGICRIVWPTARCPAAPFHAAAHPGRRSGCRVLRQRYHYHPVFQGSLPPPPHSGDAAHTFPSPVMVPCFNLIKVLPPTSLQANISPRSFPSITCINVPDILCPYILIFRSGKYKKIPEPLLSMFIARI